MLLWGMAEKGDKADKGEKMKEEMKEEKKANKTERRRGRRFFDFLLLILIVIIIIILLIVIQVPYTTTNAITQKVPVENCTLVDIPFVSVFKTGFTYDAASNIYSSDEQALYRYSDFKGYLYATIRNMGDEKGVYCLDAQAYRITGFTNDENSLASFQNLLAEESDQVQKIDNWASTRYTYPVCTGNPIYPADTDIISLWTPLLLSDDVQAQGNLKDVYILFTVVPPTSEQCKTVSVENITQQEVIKYCNAWKHIVGMC
jgi:hypothetical protein